jgi:hypothetical protein
MCLAGLPVLAHLPAFRYRGLETLDGRSTLTVRARLGGRT